MHFEKAVLSHIDVNCESLENIVYLTVNPIYCNKGIFSDYTYEKATLTLAGGALKEIGNKVPWKYFLSIKEDPASGIISVNPDEDVVTGVYSVDGSYISESADNLNPGIYVVRSNNAARLIIVR